jgi:imidazolonepropionase
MATPILIGPFSQVLTMENLPLKGAINNEAMVVIDQGGLVMDGEVIINVGKYDQLANDYATAKKLEMDGSKVLLPGLIDAHTHICYHGNRAGDYEARNSGKSYLEIAANGGGIWSTVKHTREAHDRELTDGIIHRLDRLMHGGVTTVEVKSGYGLNTQEELKMLRSIVYADSRHVLDVIPTCLAAHTIPGDFEGDSQDYLENILKELVPQIQSEDLCNRFDIFIEQSAFDTVEAGNFLRALRVKGFEVTIHGDQFTTGGSRVGVSVGAVSVDHLEASGDKEIELLSTSNTAAVVLPGASIGLGEPFAPARKLLDAGCLVVIASDWNPGSAPQGNLVGQAAILGCYEKLTAAEIFAGLTFRAAHVLRLENRGALVPGGFADAVAFPCDHYEEILYHQGELKPQHLWKKGQMIF